MMKKKEIACPDCKVLLSKIKSLELKISNLEKENQALKKENQALKKENQALKKKLHKYENPHTPPSRLYSNNNSSLTPKKPGRKKGHMGLTRPTPKPTKIVEATLDKCPICNKPTLKLQRVEKRIIEELPKPQPLEIIEYRQYHYKCSNCKEYIIAEHPDCPKQGRFGKRLLTKVAQLKYEERLPHRKIINLLLRDYGLKISVRSIFEMTHRVACALENEYKRIRNKLRKRKVVNVDETGIKVNGKNYWIWMFITLKETVVVIEKRCVRVLKSILGNSFKGIIICDGLKIYHRFTRNIQRCWAHILREARFILKQTKQGRHFLEVLNKIYQEVVFYYEVPPPRSKKLSIYYAFKKRLKYWLDKDWEEEIIKKFIRKLRGAMDYLFTCVLHPKVEPTNNRAERALREHVILRKIIGTLRNKKGTRIHEIITSVFATWKQLGLNINDQLLNYL